VEVVQKLKFPNNSIEYNILANDEIQNIRIIDNPWTRLFHFCEDFVNEVKKSNPNIKETWRIEIENETINLSYGIRVGMNWANVKSILGSAYETEDLVWHSKNGHIYSYAAMYIGFGYWVKFYVVDEKIVKITYLIEK
jgi:hypothetical protein